MNLRELPMGEQQAACADALVVRMRRERKNAFSYWRYEPTRFPCLGEKLATNAELFFGHPQQLGLDIAQITRIGDEPGQPPAGVNPIAVERSLDKRNETSVSPRKRCHWSLSVPRRNYLAANYASINRTMLRARGLETLPVVAKVEQQLMITLKKRSVQSGRIKTELLSAE